MKLKRKEEASGPPTVIISKSRYRYLLSQVAKYRRLQLLTELDEAGEDFDITDYGQLRDYALRDIFPLRRQIGKLEEENREQRGSYTASEAYITDCWTNIVNTCKVASEDFFEIIEYVAQTR